MLRCGANRLVASSVVASAEGLIATYPAKGPSTLRELQDRNVPILFGMDACQLHRRLARRAEDEQRLSPRYNNGLPFDLVIFQHPHLGDYDADETDLRQRHASLIAHYLQSAKVVAKRIHVALCANQAESWRLHPAAADAGLTLVTDRIPIQNPFHEIFPDVGPKKIPGNVDLQWQSSYTVAGRKVRRVLSKRHGGSRHWMGRYGYRHVRTIHSKTTAVSLQGSFHYIFERSDNDGSFVTLQTTTTTVGDLSGGESAKNATCSICGISFGSGEALHAHLEAPALPIMVEIPSRANVGKPPCNVSISPALPTKTVNRLVEDEKSEKIWDENESAIGLEASSDDRKSEPEVGGTISTVALEGSGCVGICIT